MKPLAPVTVAHMQPALRRYMMLYRPGWPLLLRSTRRPAASQLFYRASEKSAWPVKQAHGSRVHSVVSRVTILEAARQTDPTRAAWRSRG